MDAIDRKILTVLQGDANISIAELADRVGLSRTPCWKRIQKLEADRCHPSSVWRWSRRGRSASGSPSPSKIRNGDHSQALAGEIRRRR